MKKDVKVAGLVLTLVAVVFGGVLFVGAASGWFDETKVVLSEEYYCTECSGELIELKAEGYGELVAAKKSFLVVIDQAGCTTAERLKDYAARFSVQAGARVYKMMFSEMKETSLHEKVKYYPSFVVISQGKVARFLRADSDEDAEMYNNYEAFEAWVEGLVAGGKVD